MSQDLVNSRVCVFVDISHGWRSVVTYWRATHNSLFDLAGTLLVTFHDETCFCLFKVVPVEWCNAKTEKNATFIQYKYTQRLDCHHAKNTMRCPITYNLCQFNLSKTRQSKHCGFCIYIFDNSFDQSKSMLRLVRSERMVLSGLVFARKIARMILIKNI